MKDIFQQAIKNTFNAMKPSQSTLTYIIATTVIIIFYAVVGFLAFYLYKTFLFEHQSFGGSILTITIWFIISIIGTFFIMNTAEEYNSIKRKIKEEDKFRQEVKQRYREIKEEVMEGVRA